VGSTAPAIGGAGRGGGPGGGGYTLMDTTIAGQGDRDETSLMDGIDLSLPGLARFAGPTPPPALTTALASLSDQVSRATRAFDSGNDAGAAAPLESGLAAVRALRASLGSMGLAEDARYNLNFRLGTSESYFEQAVVAAHVLSTEAVADDGLVIAGQTMRVTLAAVNRGASDVTISGVELSGFEGATLLQRVRASCTGLPMVLKKDATFTCTSNVAIPNDAPLTEPYFTDQYWKNQPSQAINRFDPSVPFGVPFAPSPFRAVFLVKAGNVDLVLDRPIEYRYVKDLYFGDKRTELNVVPAFSVKVTPALAIVPAAASVRPPAPSRLSARSSCR
jgi:hypothetical protein